MRNMILALILLLTVVWAHAEPPAGSFRVTELPDNAKGLERVLVDVAVGLGAARLAEEALIELELNTWRSESPDDFVPGPMNSVLGSVGLADARIIHVAIQGDDLTINWERRMRAEGLQTLVIAKRREVLNTSLEEWELLGIGPGLIARALARMWFATDHSGTTLSSWTRFDRYARGRSSLFASLDRACDYVSFAVTEEGAAGVVFEFDGAVSLVSLMRAIDRVVPTEGAWTETATGNYRVFGEIAVRGYVYVPVAAVGLVRKKPVVVLGLNEEHAVGVYRTISEIEDE